MPSSTIILKKQDNEVLKLENKIRSLSFIEEAKINRMLIITTEIFDNIITHSKELESDIILRIYYNKDIQLLFIFKSSNFGIFIQRPKSSQIYYDSKNIRYRGFGVRMCYNLCNFIHYRMTPRYNAIRIIL